MSVKKTRNLNTWTESQFWGRIRSALRRLSMYWKPAQEAKTRARRPYKGTNKRVKWEYQCNSCKKWYKGNQVDIDHIIEAGSLKCSDDLKGFVERLFIEDVDGYQVLCKPCHKNKKK